MEEKVKILLCEDDENLGMLLREFLQAKGFNADLCSDGERGYKAFLKGQYDLCVLDVMMPKKDGFTLAQEIRNVNADVPIIFLTAKTLKDDVLEGFKIGADDYITKPFSMEELVSRIGAILRRVRGKKDREITMYRLGKYTFDTQKRLSPTANLRNSQQRNPSFSPFYALMPTTYLNATSRSNQSGSTTTTSMQEAWTSTSPSSANTSKEIRRWKS